MKRVHALIVTAALSAGLTAGGSRVWYHRSAPAPVAAALPSRADAIAPVRPGIHRRVLTDALWQFAIEAKRDCPEGFGGETPGVGVVISGELELPIVVVLGFETILI